jgi:DNA primase
MYHPELNKFQCATQLLDNTEVRLDDSDLKPQALRVLSEDMAVSYHLNLTSHPEALIGLEGFGFTRPSIRSFKLGYAEVLTPVLPEEYTLLESAPNIEWLTRQNRIGAEVRVPYQRQWRYSVPVYEQGRLRQVLYRKADPDALGAKIQMEPRAGAQWLYNRDILETSEYAVMVEGWGDVIALWQAGIPAVTGIAGAGQFRKDWEAVLGHVKRLYVVGDADAAGDALVRRVREAIPWARKLTLPWENGSKMDIRDLWLAGWREAEFSRWLRQADLRATIKR